MPMKYTYQLDGEMFASNDPILTGRQIRTNANLNPASNFILIAIGEKASRSIGLEEKIQLCEDDISVFLSFKSDRVFSLIINERGYEWGTDEISAADIRQYANIPDKHELVLDSSGDKIIEEDEVVYLKPKGVERILSRPPKKLKIFVNTREKLIEPGNITFIELVKLAFPDLVVGPNTAFTASYRKGHGNCPEGTLIEGESIKLKKGMIFNVSATDKS